MGIVGTALAGLALSCVVAPQDAQQWQGLVKEAGLSITDAIDRGLAEAGKGVVYHAELEVDAGSLVYSIDVWQGKGGVNVVLDAKTGAVVEREDEPSDASKRVAACKIDLARAIAAAAGPGGRPVIEAQLRLRGGRPLVEVVALADGAVETVAVDGVTGEVIGGAPRGADSGVAPEEFQSTFAVDKADLVAHGRNPYFVLEPGWQLVLEGKEGRDDLRVEITILDETREVDGVTCAVLEERETENGELAEVSRNFFAISKRSNAVYYFGEEVDDYEDGEVVAHKGAWLSGAKDARFGLYMPGTPIVGSRFYNEYAPGVALDRVEVVSVTEEVVTPAGTFGDCVRWRETTPLEPSAQDDKVFGRGVGFVRDGPLVLVRYGREAEKKR